MLAQLCDLVPCAALILDSSQRRILHCNPALADLFGYALEDLIGEPAGILSSPGDREMNESAVLAGIGAGRPWSCQLRGQRADGAVMLLQVEAGELTVIGQPEKVLLELVRPLAGPTQEQQALMEARVRYHALLSDIPEAVIVFEAQTLKVLEVNETAVQRYGYSRADWMKMTIMDIRPADQRHRTLQCVLNTSDDRVAVHEQIIHRCKDGSVFPVDVYTRLQKLEGRNVIVAVCVDISEKLRAQEHRWTSERIYRSIVTNSPFGVLVYKLESAGRMVVELVNSAAERILKISAAECLGRSLFDVFPGANNPEAMERYRRAITEQAVIDRAEIDYRDDRVCGTYHLINFPGGPGQGVLLMEDITQRKAMEQALAESELRYRTLVESSSDMIFTLDENLRIVSMNAPLTRAFGISPEQVAGRSLGEFIGDMPTIAEGRRLAQECFQTGRGRICEQTINWQGHELSLNASLSPITDSAGHTRQLVVMVRNVTPVREMERKLAQTHKLDALGRLAGGIAHDFNNLLACIQGNLDLALMGDVGDPANRQGLTSAREASERAALLVRHILAFTRQSRARPVRVDLNATVAEAMRMLRGSLSDKIYTAHEGAEDLWPVCIDPSQATQVLMNLCLNARDAMPAGGKLIVSTANLTLDDEFCRRHLHARPGPFAQLSVIDTGTGIAPEIMEQIFEPFFTTKPVGEGSGLGLSVAYGIITQAGGWIDVTSHPGQGSRFDVYIPKDG